jgi:hypothetical protein
MVLAQAVENAKGLTLAAPGTVLTDRLMMRFENMNVAVVWVQEEEKMDGMRAEKMKADLEQRFALAGDSEVWADLKAILLERIERRVK